MRLKARGSNSKNPLAGFDVLTVLIILAISMIGILFIANAKSGPFTGEEHGFRQIWDKINFNYPSLQIRWFLLGLVLMLAVCLVDYHTYAELSLIGWAIMSFVLFVLLLAGKIAGNTTRGIAGWIMVGSHMLQPSELTKLILIIIVAKYASRAVDTDERVKPNRDFFQTLGLVAVPFGLVLAQPDAGTAAVFIAITAGILFAGRLSWKLIVGFVLLIVIAVVVAFFTGAMGEYQQARLLNFFHFTDPAKLQAIGINPKILDKFTNDQAVDALRAIGSGGMTGKGFFQANSYVQLGYLPAAHTDFIFATGMEATGLVGGLVLMGLYLLLILRALYHGFNAKDSLGYFIVVGVVSMELAHIFENIGMNIGLMPITGIPLPFVSYGGSSMWTNMMAFGLVINVAMRKPNKRYRGGGAKVAATALRSL